MKNKRKEKKSPVSAICSALGTVLLVVLIIGCVPLTVPRMFGYNIYTVISGSMEPAIPVGSLVYVKYLAPHEIVEDDVIAFYGTKDEPAIITHRVVSNSPAMGQFITKGDANEKNDMSPIPYNNYIGRVERSFPKVGAIAKTVTTLQGKIAAASLILLAVLLEIVAVKLDQRKKA